MTNAFNPSHRSYFNADDGAYSKISANDEANKKQITLTGHERDLVVSFYGNSILIGKVSDPSGKGKKEFVHYNAGKVISLGLVYPKEGKNELRLYMSNGFGGGANDVWYVFKKDSMLHVGTMPLKQWEQISQSDLEDENYQTAIQLYQDAPPSKKESINSSFPRSAKIASAALRSANYKCFNNPSHLTFEGIAGKQYMEAHHILPIARQDKFSINIDIEENIVSLCPTCHRLIHLGTKAAKEALLNKLYADRKSFFESEQLNLSLQALKDMY